MLPVDVDHLTLHVSLEALLRALPADQGLSLTDSNASWGEYPYVMHMFPAWGGNVFCEYTTKREMMALLPHQFRYSSKSRHVFCLCGTRTVGQFLEVVQTSFLKICGWCA